MHIKKYVANSIQEALKQVKKELGPEALILSVNNIKARTGPLALMSPARVEVTVAIDEDAPAYRYPAGAIGGEAQRGKGEMGRRGDGETGRRGDGEMSPCPPVPQSPSPPGSSPAYSRRHLPELSSEPWTQGGSAATAARRQQRLDGNSDWPPGNVPRLVAGQCPSIDTRAISLGVENPGHSSKVIQGAKHMAQSVRDVLKGSLRITGWGGEGGVDGEMGRRGDVEMSTCPPVPQSPGPLVPQSPWVESGRVKTLATRPAAQGKLGDPCAPTHISSLCQFLKKIGIQEDILEHIGDVLSQEIPWTMGTDLNLSPLSPGPEIAHSEGESGSGFQPLEGYTQGDVGAVPATGDPCCGRPGVKNQAFLGALGEGYSSSVHLERLARDILQQLVKTSGPIFLGAAGRIESIAGLSSIDSDIDNGPRTRNSQPATRNNPCIDSDIDNGPRTRNSQLVQGPENRFATRNNPCIDSDIDNGPLTRNSQPATRNNPCIDNGPRPKYVALVGPTGTGKTTTIAKLSADILLKRKKKVGLITIDTYRVAAIEQLNTYAGIMNIPIKLASTFEQMRQAVLQYQDQRLDVVLIDTAGFSHHDREHLQLLNAFLAQVVNPEIHLVLSANTDGKELIHISQRFNLLHYEKLLFTKIDESSYPGTIFNHMVYTGKPISYLTTGQKVPEDIEVATPAGIINMMFQKRQFYAERDKFKSVPLSGARMRDHD